MRLIVSVLGIVAFVGCSDHHNNNNGDGGGGFGGGGSGGGGGGSLPPMLKANLGLDVAHIRGFAIAGSMAGLSRAWPNQGMDGGTTTMTQTLYTIDDMGNIVATSLTTSSDSDMSTTATDTHTPAAIFNTAKNVVFAFKDIPLKIQVDAGMMFVTKDCAAVILRKSDAALFCLDLPQSLTNTTSFNIAQVDSDGGNQLFLRDLALVRIDMGANPPQATALVTPMGTDAAAGTLTANLDADALCVVGPTNAATRIFKLNGGLQNLSAYHDMTQWLAPSGHDFYYMADMVAMGSPNIMLATRQTDGSFVVAPVGTVNVPSATFFVQTATAAYGYRAGNGTPMNEQGLVELTGPGQGTLHTVTGLAQLIEAQAGGTAAFFRGTDTIGNGAIARMDVPSFTQTMVVPPGDFTLSAMSVSSTGELTFAGLRNSDGKHIVGNVAAGASTYTILSTTAPMVTDLTRIN